MQSACRSLRLRTCTLGCPPYIALAQVSKVRLVFPAGETPNDQDLAIYDQALNILLRNAHKAGKTKSEEHYNEEWQNAEVYGDLAGAVDEEYKDDQAWDVEKGLQCGNRTEIAALWP